MNQNLKRTDVKMTKVSRARSGDIELYEFVASRLVRIENRINIEDGHDRPPIGV